MSIQSTIGNVKVGAQNQISSILSSAKATVDNIIGSATTGLSNIWSGGFAGMSDEGMEALQTALRGYCDAIEEKIGSFQEEGNISTAYKGVINTAARDYIRSIKELLNAYVSLMKTGIAESEEARKAYMDYSSAVSQSVTSDAESIRSEAASIRLD